MIFEELNIIFKSFIDSGYQFSFNEQFGYLSERISNTGSNLKIELKIQATEEIKNIIVKDNIISDSWKIHFNEQKTNEKTQIIILKSKSFYLLQDIIGQINYLIKSISLDDTNAVRNSIEKSIVELKNEKSFQKIDGIPKIGDIIE